MAVEGAFEAWPRGRRLPRPRPIRIRYGKPIDITELESLSADDIAIRIRRELVALQRQLGSSHAAKSEMRIESDIQAGRKRLVVARELSE